MDLALQGNAPCLHRRFGEAQRFKWDGKPGDPALLIDLPAGIPNRVEAEIFIVVGREAFPLHPQRIDDEFVSTTVIVEAINPDIHKVVVPDIVAMTEVSTNLARLLIKTDKHGVEILVVVA